MLHMVLLVLVAGQASPSADLVFATGLEDGFLGLSDQRGGWALFETFDGDPPSPSQDLLPDTFDFVATHRTHPRNHEPEFPPFPADHGTDCRGPAPPLPALHMVETSHTSDGSSPDESFFVCKNHMMSSMGEVDGYSVTAFWARQEFDFSNGGVLELDVNLNDGHPRSWWEILITPRELAKVGAAHAWLPIDETYPTERIVLELSEQTRRWIGVGTNALDPDGWQVEESDWRSWRTIDPTDPALDDRRIRRKMRVTLAEDGISWEIEKQDGSFDDFSVDVPGGLPFDRGLVIFKTHAYTPLKDANTDEYTFHWDNIRFDGPVVGRYEAFETAELGYLQANGSRSIGESLSMTIDLPEAPSDEERPVLFGQLHGALAGQVLLRVNGGAERVVHPLDYADHEGGGCATNGWASFRVPLTASELRSGGNDFEWTIGPRPACATWHWDGFSVKGLEIQLDGPSLPAAMREPGRPVVRARR